MIYPKANQPSFSSDADVVLYIGQPPTDYHVEMDVICDVSPVFKAAFTGGFRETVEKTMKLPEEDLTDFGRFMQWAHEDIYPLAEFKMDGSADERVTELARLYVVADKYDVVKLKHNIIDRMFEIGQCFSPTYGPPHNIIRYVYHNTPRSSHFRRLMAVWYLGTRTSRMISTPAEDELERELPELKLEIARELQWVGETNPFLWDRRAFYESDSIALWRLTIR